MIVDTHTHLWRSPDELGAQLSAQMRLHAAEPFDQLDAGPTAHEAAMTPVSAAFVLGYRSRRLGATVPNEFISSYVTTHSNRFYGFASIDPLVGGYLDELAALPEMRFSGVTVSPTEQGFHPSHTCAMELYERCQAMSMPLIIHQGGPFAAADACMEYAQPYLIDGVARSFPQLKIVLAHCAQPFVDQALVLIGKHRNVYAEISGVVSRPWQLYNVLLLAHQMDVTDRLLFGSNFPHLTPQRAVEAVFSLNQFTQGTGLTSVPREKLRSIVERDALACLGLRRGSGPTATATPIDPEVAGAATRPAPMEAIRHDV